MDYEFNGKYGHLVLGKAVGEGSLLKSLNG